MAVATAVAIYFLIWWIVLFAVLPWGVRAQDEDSPPGTDPGAPRVPRLVAKLLWTTVVAGAGVGGDGFGLRQRLGDDRRACRAARFSTVEMRDRQGKKIEQGQSPAPISLGLI